MTSPGFSAQTENRIRNLLMPGEIVRYAAQRHWLSYRRAFFWLLLALVCLVLVLTLRQSGGPYSLWWSDVSRNELGTRGIQQLMCEYMTAFFLLLAVGFVGATAILNWTLVIAVTNRRIILRAGLVARDMTDLPLSKIDIVMVDQGIIERLTDSGSVTIRTLSESVTRFTAIRQPTEFRNAITGAMEETGDNKKP